jgi:Resolvase, N terminal domain
MYGDAGISGPKGRDKRPGFDAMLKTVAKREFDILTVWSSDRLGRAAIWLNVGLWPFADVGGSASSDPGRGTAATRPTASDP